MHLGETTDPTAATSRAVADDNARRRPGRRPKLTSSQQDEVVRLYGDATVSTAAIRERFGIQDATLYRLLQRRGVSPRGRTAAPRSSRRGRPVATPRAARRTAAPAESLKQHSFSVNFRGVSVVRGRSALEVVRELERLGATDIEEIQRQ